MCRTVEQFWSICQFLSFQLALFSYNFLLFRLITQEQSHPGLNSHNAEVKLISMYTQPVRIGILTASSEWGNSADGLADPSKHIGISVQVRLTPKLL